MEKLQKNKKETQTNKGSNGSLKVMNISNRLLHVHRTYGIEYGPQEHKHNKFDHYALQKYIYYRKEIG